LDVLVVQKYEIEVEKDCCVMVIRMWILEKCPSPDNSGNPFVKHSGAKD
jgi:hypothetical protein